MHIFLWYSVAGHGGSGIDRAWCWEHELGKTEDFPWLSGRDWWQFDVETRIDQVRLSYRGFIETMGLSLNLFRSISINHSFAKLTKNLTNWREEVQLERDPFPLISSMDYLQFDLLIGAKERVILTGNILLLVMIFPIISSSIARWNSRKPDQMANNNSTIDTWCKRQNGQQHSYHRLHVWYTIYTLQSVGSN